MGQCEYADVMKALSYALRVALVPIVYIGWWVVWLVGQAVGFFLGLALSFLVSWVRWRHGREAADEFRRSIAQWEEDGRAWRRGLFRRGAG
jgi:hypothetical protein